MSVKFHLIIISNGPYSTFSFLFLFFLGIMADF